MEPPDGTELMVALQYSKKHNASIELVVTNDTDPWGEAFENWTGTGVVGLLVDDRGDFGFGK